MLLKNIGLSAKMILYAKEEYKMLHGELSNSAEGSIAFRVDKFLFRLNPDGKTYKLDYEVFKAVENVYYGSFYTVDYVCMLVGKNEVKFRQELEELLEVNNIPSGRIYIIKHDEEVRFHLTKGDYLYYADDVAERVDKIASEHCINLSQLHFILRGRVKRNARRRI